MSTTVSGFGKVARDNFGTYSLENVGIIDKTTGFVLHLLKELKKLVISASVGFIPVAECTYI